jgi:ABC-type multidrug transport system permease subunit
MFLFGGVFFPFSNLPTWAQVIGWCLPLSHLVEATRDLVLGDLSWMIAAHAGALLGLLAVLFPFPPSRLSRTLLR